MGATRTNDTLRLLPAAGSGAGVVVGVIVMLGAWILDLQTHGLAFTPENVVTIHLRSPAHFMVDVFPIMLGWMGWVQFRNFEHLWDRRRLRSLVRASQGGWAGANLANSMIDGVLLVSREGRIDELNGAASRIFGYKLAELRGQPIHIILPDHDQVKGQVRYRTTFSKEVLGAAWSMNGRHRDGTTFPIELSYAPTADQRFVYVVKDATDRVRAEKELQQQAEQAAQKAAALPAASTMPQHSGSELPDAPSSFFRNVTYQVRGPLNEIVGYTEVILDRGKLDENDDRVLRSIAGSSRKLLGLINNVLDYQKLEKGRMSVLLEPVHIPRLVLEVEHATRAMVEENDNHFELLLDPMVAAVRTDGARLRQVLINLLSNAARFTTNGTVRLEVGFRDEDDDQRWVALRVRDTGIGMAPERLTQLLSDDALDRAVRDGSGLGVALIKQVTALIGGRLEASSVPGEGSLFTILLPTPYKAGTAPPPEDGVAAVAAALTFNAPPDDGPPSIAPPGVLEDDDPDADRTHDDEEQADADEGRSKRRRSLLGSELPGTLVAGASRGEGDIDDNEAPLVLLIDDEPPALRELVVRHLGANGFRVAVATTGNDGLRLANDEQPVAIILEVMVTDRDGWEVLEVLKSEPDLRNIPVVVASLVDDETRAISMGAVVCLPKPVDRSRLLSAIERSLRETPVVQVVDSNDEVRGHVARALGLAGWKVEECKTGNEAIERLDNAPPAVLVLSPGLSDMNDSEFLTLLHNHAAAGDVPLVAYGVPHDEEVEARYHDAVQAVVTEGDIDHITRLVGHAVATLLARGDDT